MIESVIYLDNNSTTPIDKRVLEAMMPFFTDKFANASSPYLWGRKNAEAIEKARQQVADFLDVTPDEIFFTSGASESIFLGLTGIYQSFKSFRNRIVTTAVEHKAVLHVLDYLENIGAEVIRLGVDRQGYINLEELKEVVDDKTIMVAVQLANNETGVIQPLEQISQITHKHGAVVFSDATQAPGKMLFNIHDLGIDCMPLSAHKFYGPKGVGALFVRRKNPRVMMKPLVEGNTENNFRLGTHNVPAIVGMGEALKIVKENQWEEVSRFSKLRTRLEHGLIEGEFAFINGTSRDRISNTTNIYFPGIKASQLIKECPQLAFSLGSACTSNLGKPSFVLKAMGLSDNQAGASVRLSIGRFNTDSDIDTAIKVIKGSVEKLRCF